MLKFNLLTFIALGIGIFCGSKINTKTYNIPCETRLFNTLGHEAALEYANGSKQTPPASTNIFRSEGRSDSGPAEDPIAIPLRDYFIVPSGEDAPFNRWLREQNKR